MASGTWDRMWDLFHRGLELPSAERAAFLAAACDDGDLRRQVAELLRSQAELPGSATIGDAEAERSGANTGTPPHRADDLVGSQFGPYRLVRQLGSGGMGVVYLAERADGELQQRVAIKVLPSQAPQATSTLRFQRERQILARLEHPYIARLMDAQTTEDGRPYFVMEYVEGQPIDRYCRERRLSLDKRLALVVKVCHAVQRAHQNLIVHRDLKPDNILVTGEGEPKLLDFGVAKLLAPTSVTGEAALTIDAWHPLTPAYASPEQLRGETVTTASDVYSLGVLLYELVTGCHPCGETTSKPLELLRLVQEYTPAAPSATVLRTAVQDSAGERSARFGSTPARLAKRLRGDLDTIVATALQQDPERRYSSAQQLADDIERHLQDLPVHARQDTLRYRARKLIRRYPVASGSAAVSVFLLAVLAFTMTIFSLRLQRERTRVDAQRAEAVIERQRAERVSELLVDVFRASYPNRSRGETVTARELLDRGADRVLEGLGDEPLIQSRLVSTIGLVYESLGLYDEASEMSERNLALRQTLHGEQHLEVAEAMWELAALRQGMGLYEEAEKLHRSSIGMRRQLLGWRAPEVAWGLNALAVSLHDAGRYEASEDAFREAFEIRLEHFGATSWQVAQVQMNLGWLVHNCGRFDEASALYEAALSTQRKVVGDKHRWVAQALNNIALLHHDRGEFESADQIYQEAWQLDLELFRGERRHPDLAIHLHNQARLQQDLGNLERAEELYLEALEIRRASLRPNHAAIGTSLAGLGRLRLDQGDAKAAASHLRTALETRRSALAPGNWLIAEAEVLLGASLYALGDFEQASALLTKSVPQIVQQRGSEDLRARQALGYLQELQARNVSFAEAGGE